MKYSAYPAADYTLDSKVETEEPAEFAAFLRTVPADAPVAWYSHKDEGAHLGVWVRRSTYRLKHGSFVDPYELSAYAAQYYEAAEGGRHEAVQIGRTPETMAAPEGVLPVATAGQLLEALTGLVPADAGEGFEGAECTAPMPMKYLQPDYVFEFHGALTRGWHGQLYVAEGVQEVPAAQQPQQVLADAPQPEDAAPAYLLVLR